MIADLHKIWYNRNISIIGGIRYVINLSAILYTMDWNRPSVAHSHYCFTCDISPSRTKEVYDNKKDRRK